MTTRVVPERRTINVRNIEQSDYGKINAAKSMDGKNFDQWMLEAALEKAERDHPELFPES